MLRKQRGSSPVPITYQLYQPKASNLFFSPARKCSGMMYQLLDLVKFSHSSEVYFLSDF